MENVAILERKANPRSNCDLFPEIGQNCDCDDQFCARSSEAEQIRTDGKIDNSKGKLEDYQPSVRISMAEWRNLVEVEDPIHIDWEICEGERPPLDAIRAKLRSILHLQGEVQIGSMDRRSILLQFSLEEDRRRVWLKRQAMVEGVRL